MALDKRYLWTREEIVDILDKSVISSNLDKKTLGLWECLKIGTEEAKRQIIFNNRATDKVEGIDDIAFREFAWGLGYRRNVNG